MCSNIRIVLHNFWALLFLIAHIFMTFIHILQANCWKIISVFHSFVSPLIFFIIIFDSLKKEVIHLMMKCEFIGCLGGRLWQKRELRGFLWHHKRNSGEALHHLVHLALLICPVVVFLSWLYFKFTDSTRYLKLTAVYQWVLIQWAVLTGSCHFFFMRILICCRNKFVKHLIVFKNNNDNNNKG